MKGPSYGQRVVRRLALPAAMAVLHLRDAEEEAVCEARKAVASGVDGLFLICHGSVDSKRTPLQVLSASFRAIRADLGEAVFLGVNVLQLAARRPMDLFEWVRKELPSCDAVWMDNCFANNPRLMQDLHEQRKGFSGLYFGGVAFKHQDKVHPNQDEPLLGDECKRALSRAARAAQPFVDCVITSGVATGDRPSLAKVQALYDACSPVLAISGFGLDIPDGMPNAIHFCATDVSSICPEHGCRDKCDASFCHFDEDRLKEWVRKVKHASKNGS